jgi:hypothetical protein
LGQIHLYDYVNQAVAVKGDLGRFGWRWRYATGR